MCTIWEVTQHSKELNWGIISFHTDILIHIESVERRFHLLISELTTN